MHRDIVLNKHMQKKLPSIFDGLNNFKDSKFRNYFTWLILGTLGQGKSTFIRQLIKLYQATVWAMQGVKRRILIIDPSEAISYNEFEEITLSEIKYGVKVYGESERRPWIEGVRVLRTADFVKDYEWVKIINEHFANGMLILDESKMYISNNGTPNEHLKELFTKHRNKCFDLVVVGHTLKSLHRDFRAQVKIFVMFPMGNDTIKSQKHMEDDNYPPQLYDAYQMAKKEFKKDRNKPKHERDQRTLKMQKAIYYNDEDGILGVIKMPEV